MFIFDVELALCSIANHELNSVPLPLTNSVVLLDQALFTSSFPGLS
jgi:hypothetical protein